MKRFLALFLVCATLVGMIPAVFAVNREPQPTPIKEEDYHSADLMWDAVNAKEAEMQSKKASVSQTVEALIATVTSSAYYEDDSLIRRGEAFFWETTDGIPCGYSPRLRKAMTDAKPLENYDAVTAQDVITTSYASKGGYPQSKNVYLIQPYYGLDDSFTTQYVVEANEIARATGGTSTIYRTSKATVDRIADSMEKGAVVIFDSHGDTDYAYYNDYTSEANTSYICLQTGEGLTDADYAAAQGPFGKFYHAYYAGSYNYMKSYCVDGTVIANHMDQKAPNNLLWMGLCLGMATDGLFAPLRGKGVEVAYGYSQSVTFAYDYEWEAVFWDEMRKGYAVANAIATMKKSVGLWDWCHEYDTLEMALDYYCAFPIVVSSEDVYPGHGNVDALQKVNSAWCLTTNCAHKHTTYFPANAPSCTNSGNIAYYECLDCLKFFTDAGFTTQTTKEATLVPAAEHHFVDYVCEYCGAVDKSYPFTDVNSDTYYFTPILWASQMGITTGTSATNFSPEKFCTRGQIVTFLWRANNCPEPTLTESPFTDVPENEYYTKAVLWAVEKGITTGINATTFAPEKTCTRGQVVTFLWRAQGKPTPTNRNNPFSDVAETEYYYDAVLWAVEEAITQGTSQGKFSPERSCTRGQIVTFLYRTMV